ncbi:hypothetical protein VNO77_19900 [Canavalia gladiata]|uniref:Uncharacterized protein n=1 Tax=Canavalia gladiata TaxID=3824 RepID=A0AAN9QKU2_CANGL
MVPLPVNCHNSYVGGEHGQEKVIEPLEIDASVSHSGEETLERSDVVSRDRGYTSKAKNLVRGLRHEFLAEVRANEATSANHADHQWLDRVPIEILSHYYAFSFFRNHEEEECDNNNDDDGMLISIGASAKMDFTNLYLLPLLPKCEHQPRNYSENLANSLLTMIPNSGVSLVTGNFTICSSVIRQNAVNPENKLCVRWILLPLSKNQLEVSSEYRSSLPFSPLSDLHELHFQDADLSFAVMELPYDKESP